MPRLKKKYNKTVVANLIKEFGYTNKMTIPKVVKVVVNMGVGEAIQNVKILDTAAVELAAVTGQKPIIRRAKKAIAAFHLRAGMPIGLKVTLRRAKMYEFIDRLFSIGLPRVRDFRGVSPQAFDGRGNYTLGLKDQFLFPEIDLAKSDEPRGMNVTFVTTAKTDEEARFLLKEMGMPFGKKEERRLLIA